MIPLHYRGLLDLLMYRSVVGGDTAGNGWGRPISMSSGMDYWIGSWVDSGGGDQTWDWDGAVWNQVASGVPAVTTSSVMLTTSLASLGLSISDTFVFDVFTTGGGGGGAAPSGMTSA